MRRGARWTAATLVLAACLAVVAVMVVSETRSRLSGERPQDFAQMYIVSWSLRHGGPVYAGIETPPELVRRLGWHYREDYSFANPPAILPVVAPLSLLPYRVAWWSLFGFSVLAVVSAMYMTARALGLGRWPAVLLGGSIATTLPFVSLVVLNRIESLVVLLGTVGWIALRRGRLRVGGVLWGLCAAFKLFPALWIVALLRAPFRRAAWSAVAAGAIVTLIGAMAVGLEDVLRFVGYAMPQAALYRESPGNFSILALTSVLGFPALGWIIGGGLGVVTCVQLLRRPPSVDHAWVASAAAALLISPLSWSYYFVLLGPCTLVLARLLDWERGGDRALIYVLVLLLFYWPWLLGILRIPASTAGTVAAFAPTIGLLIMLGTVLRRLPEPRLAVAPGLAVGQTA